MLFHNLVYDTIVIAKLLLRMSTTDEEDEHLRLTQLRKQLDDGLIVDPVQLARLKIELDLYKNREPEWLNTVNSLQKVNELATKREVLLIQREASAWLTESALPAGSKNTSSSVDESVSNKEKRKLLLDQAYDVITSARDNIAENQALISGSVRVFARLRPRSNQVDPRSSKPIDATTQHTTITANNTKLRVGDKERPFEYVFDTTASTGLVYDSLKWMINAAVVHGRHGVLFAYGPSGSGKTYTMDHLSGHVNATPLESMGLYYRFVNDLTSPSVRLTHELYISAIQIKPDDKVVTLQTYEDLLRPTPVKTTDDITQRYISNLMPLKYHIPSAGNIKIPDVDHYYIHEERVLNAAEFDTKLKLITSRRSVNSQALNEESSRSHLIIHFILKPIGTGDKSQATVLSLVDLAGSETTSSTEVMGNLSYQQQQKLIKVRKERAGINESLGVLRYAMEHYTDKIDINTLPRSAPGALVRHLYFALRSATSGKVSFLLQVNPWDRTDGSDAPVTLTKRDVQQAEKFSAKRSAPISSAERLQYIESIRTSVSTVSVLTATDHPYAKQLLLQDSDNEPTDADIAMHEFEGIPVVELKQRALKANQYSQTVRLNKVVITDTPLNNEEQQSYDLLMQSKLSVNRDLIVEDASVTRSIIDVDYDTESDERLALFELFEQRYTQAESSPLSSSGLFSSYVDQIALNEAFIRDGKEATFKRILRNLSKERSFEDGIKELGYSSLNLFSVAYWTSLVNVANVKSKLLEQSVRGARYIDILTSNVSETIKSQSIKIPTHPTIATVNDALNRVSDMRYTYKQYNDNNSLLDALSNYMITKGWLDSDHQVDTTPSILQSMQVEIRKNDEDRLRHEQQMVASLLQSTREAEALVVETMKRGLLDSDTELMKVRQELEDKKQELVYHKALAAQYGITEDTVNKLAFTVPSTQSTVRRITYTPPSSSQVNDVLYDDTNHTPIDVTADESTIREWAATPTVIPALDPIPFTKGVRLGPQDVSPPQSSSPPQQQQFSNSNRYVIQPHPDAVSISKEWLNMLL
jgi:hypothetical protein